MFPKNDHVSIGVGGPAILSKQMMPYYYRFLDYIDFKGSHLSEVSSRYPASSIQHPASRIQHQVSSIQHPFPITHSLKSWPIPVRTQKGNFHSGRALVAGDAAGLTDSLTGEGIYYAVRSGKLAAKACASLLQGQAEALRSYSDQVNDELMSELLEGKKIKHIFNTVPLKIHYFVRDNDRAWKAFGKVLRGERSYKDVKLGFGKWKVFWNLAGVISGYVEKIKTVRFMKKGYKMELYQ
jgi:flavin-dependent dehydrogenase